MCSRSTPRLSTGTDNEYLVTVEADDGTYQASRAVTVTVTEAEEGQQPEPGTLLERYDADDSGEIEKGEVITAIDEYLDEGANAPTKADVIAVINLYLGD